MEGDVEREVIDQALEGLGRAPGSAKEPVHIGPKHGTRVIEGKHRIKAFLLQLSLSGDGSSSAGHLNVGGLRVMAFQGFWVMRVLIRGEHALGPHVGLKIRHELLPLAWSLILSKAVLSPRNPGQRTFGRHPGHLKEKDPSSRWIDRKRHA